MKELMSSGISPRYSISLYSRGGIVEKFDSILISGLITVSKAKRAMMETKEISRLFTYSAYAASKFSSPARSNTVSLMPALEIMQSARYSSLPATMPTAVPSSMIIRSTGTPKTTSTP